MSSEHIIRAWKDEQYRNSLSEGARAALPAHPAGLVELTDEALDELVAGAVEASSCCWSSCNTKEPVKPSVESTDSVREAV